MPPAIAMLLCLSWQEPAVFRANVSLVHVDAAVTDAGGRILTGFAKNDFRVFDERKEQPIVQFSAEEQPLDLILLFDVSGSMRPVVQDVAFAAHEGLSELRPGDRVSVMVFNSGSRVISPFTEDLAEVERTIQNDVLSLRFGGGTHIQQAVDDAALCFMAEKRSERRRAVLIVTDNIGMRTRREETVVRDFWEADALLSGLIIRDAAEQTMHTIRSIASPQTLAMEAGMTGIAQKTGGDAIHSAEPGTAFRDMMHRMRSRYSIYYAMPQGKAGTARGIRVELTAAAAKRFPKAHVLSRHGYIVPEMK